MVTTTRVIRRVGRSSGVSAAITGAPAQRQAEREKDVAAIDAALQSLAELNAEASVIADKMAVEQAKIKELMTKTKIGNVTHALLNAQLKPKYSNEKKEVDARALFNSKHMPREHYFDCVKVQMGELGKFLSETEIRNLSKITPPELIGTDLVIKAVKPTVSKGDVVKRVRK